MVLGFRIGSVVAVFAALVTINAEAAILHARGGETYAVPSRVADLLAKAHAAVVAKDNRHAISYLTTALEAKPDPAAAAAIRDIRGSIYVDVDDLPRALADANESLRVNPRLAGAYQTRGRIYRRKNQRTKAISEYNKALELNPNFAYIYVNRAVAYAESKNYERALRDLNEAIRRAPKLADAYENRGAVYHHQKQYGKALAEYNKAIRLNPSAASAHYNRSLALVKAGQPELALREDNEVVRRGATNADEYLMRGNSYAAKGDYRQAVADWEKARQLRPTDRHVLNSIAWLKATCADQSCRNGKEAVRIALELCQLSNWKDSHYLDTLAAAYAEQGDFEKALQQQKRALQLSAGPPTKRDGMQSRLRLYQDHKPFREPTKKS